MGCFGPHTPTEKGSKMGQKCGQIVFSQQGQRATWAACRCLFSPFGAYVGCFDCPCVRKSLITDPFWDQKRVKSGPKLCVSGCAVGPTEVLECTLSAHFVAVLHCLDPPGRPTHNRKGPKCAKKTVPQEQRMRPKGQQGTREWVLHQN